MNELEFNVFSTIYHSPAPQYLREIVKKSTLPYGTVQSILNKNIHLFDTKFSGKNKYFSFRKKTDTYFLFIQLESEKMRTFMKKHPELIPFIEKCRKLDTTIIIFGSFARGNETKKSDLDIILITDSDIELSGYLCPYEIHKISLKSADLPKFRQQALYNELKYNHLIISNIDYCLNKVFECN